MKAPDFAYHRPERLPEAIELLGSLENTTSSPADNR